MCVSNSLPHINAGEQLFKTRLSINESLQTGLMPEVA